MSDEQAITRVEMVQQPADNIERRNYQWDQVVGIATSPAVTIPAGYVAGKIVDAAVDVVKQIAVDKIVNKNQEPPTQ